MRRAEFQGAFRSLALFLLAFLRHARVRAFKISCTCARSFLCLLIALHARGPFLSFSAAAAAAAWFVYNVRFAFSCGIEVFEKGRLPIEFCCVSAREFCFLFPLFFLV